jgi:hypothetical protein
VKTLLVSWLLSLALSPATLDAPVTVNAPQLFGIASLEVKKNSIEVTRDETLHRDLELRKDGRSAQRAIVKVGESFSITDGHHYGYSFKLIGTDGSVAAIEEILWTSFLGQEPTQSKSTRTVRSYVTKRKK